MTCSSSLESSFVICVAFLLYRAVALFDCSSFSSWESLSWGFSCFAFDPFLVCGILAGVSLSGVKKESYASTKEGEYK